MISDEYRSKIISRVPGLKKIEPYIYNECVDDDDYRRKLYECIFLLKKKTPSGKVLKLLKNNGVTWGNPVYTVFKEDEKEEESLEPVIGVVSCRKCKSEKVFTFNKQTRSADEGTTVFCRCSECGTRWKESG